MPSSMENNTAQITCASRSRSQKTRKVKPRCSRRALGFGRRGAGLETPATFVREKETAMEKQANFLERCPFNISSRVSLIAISVQIAFALMLLTTQTMQAQYSVLHSFTGGTDGARPVAGVTVAGAGVLYGTTSAGGTGGSGGNGTVFRLTQHGSSWVFS